MKALIDFKVFYFFGLVLVWFGFGVYEKGLIYLKAFFGGVSVRVLVYM